MTRDRTGDLLAHQDTEDHKARIRQLLCLGPRHCNFDHEHSADAVAPADRDSAHDTGDAT